MKLDARFATAKALLLYPTLQCTPAYIFLPHLVIRAHMPNPAIRIRAFRSVMLNSIILNRSRMACPLKIAMLSKLVTAPLNTDTPTSTPTFDLVVSLLRARFDTSSVLLDFALKPKFLEAIDVAGRHGIAAALAGGLKNLVATGHAWDDLVPFLGAIESANAKQNAQLCKSALSLARCLEEAGIRCINLKGVAFLFDKQADAAWRVVGDLDVLVPIESVEAAAVALLAKGYRLAIDSNFSTVA